MFLLPYSTDAPIYHWPYASVGTIVVNTLIYLFLLSLPADTHKFVESWLVLTFGNFNPITWLTTNYMHGNPLHLIFNMVFLWVFGLIVEGKIGWWKFLAIYNLIGVTYGMVLQIVTLPFSEGYALGSSAPIYGLMAMVMIWAPANHLHCASRFGTFEVPAYTFVGFDLVVQAVFAALAVTMAEHPLAMITSETLHLIGAAVGTAAGLYMLKNNLVDCEGWDIFSVWQGKHLRTREQIADDYLNSKEGQEKIQNARENVVEQIRTFTAGGESMAAWAAYKRGLNQFPGFKLEENDLLGIIAGLRKAGMWDETITMMVTFLRTYPQRDAAVRLALAQLLIEKKQRGLQAYKVLQKVDKSKLDPRQQPLLERFSAQARAMADDDPYEVAPEDW